MITEKRSQKRAREHGESSFSAAAARGVAANGALAAAYRPNQHVAPHVLVLLARTVRLLLNTKERGNQIVPDGSRRRKSCNRPVFDMRRGLHRLPLWNHRVPWVQDVLQKSRDPEPGH
ncbi:hypothetical protein L596_008013 [Steinernema carpocapsae]|uniref:Uncharacterized protein n=1 Tax=Steinernema carpocapsae TaxID=34508 RepID=A0A4U5PBP4_STECR|nr:hypothetical protein L596_008013 [Steinernema carpocapsae]